MNNVTFAKSKMVTYETMTLAQLQQQAKIYNISPWGQKKDIINAMYHYHVRHGDSRPSTLEERIVELEKIVETQSSQIQTLISLVDSLKDRLESHNL